MTTRAAHYRNRAGIPICVAGIVVLLTLVVKATALAHAVVYPKTSAAGAYERYVLRVPNERKVATTRVEMQFPSDVRVSSFEDVPGWAIQVLRDTAQRIVGASWTGTLPPERFVELPFVGANPKTATEIKWPVIQTYADGERVEWAGPAGSKRPASSTTIAATAAMTLGSWMAPVALALSLVSLGLALRPRKG
jgi:uncharacterized protein YcnI